jgi:hypothetical protein
VPLLRLSLLQLELIHQALAGKSGTTGVLGAGKALSVVAMPDGAGKHGKGRHKEIEEPVSRSTHFERSILRGFLLTLSTGACWQLELTDAGRSTVVSVAQAQIQRNKHMLEEVSDTAGGYKKDNKKPAPFLACESIA